MSKPKRTTGIRAIQAKASVTTFDLTCPYCSEYLYSDGPGTSSFPINESCPEYLECDSCGKTSRAPKRVPSTKIWISGRQEVGIKK